MPPPDDLSALRDIEHCAAVVLRWTDNLDEEAFLRDEMLESASYHQLSIIGEAVRHLSAAFRDSHPQIDWRSWNDFRNVLIHAYDTVDGARVWAVIEGELLDLHAQAVRFIAELSSDRTA
jgi:uncharacterized protein with HEPN domain